MKIKSFFLFIFLLSLFPSNAFALNAGPYSGRVIDSQTGQPIGGASVLIFWTERAYGFPESKTNFFKAQLVYTDRAGRYEIPSVYLGLGLFSSIEQTRLVVYQPGYRFFRVAQFGGQSKQGFTEKGRTVTLDRISPNFNHAGHYRAILDALSGIEEYPYSYPRKEDLFMTWNQLIGNKMRGSAEKQECLRRAEWENRSGAGLPVLSGSREENLNAIKKWNELLARGTAKEKKLALGNLSMLRYFDFKINFGLYKPVLDVLKDSDPFVREAAASLIGSVSKPGIPGRRTFKGTQVISALLEAARDRHPRVRAMAASALAYQADGRAVQPLVSLLKDSDPFVRLNAAFALGELRASESVNFLMEMLDDDSIPEYKYAQQEAVKAIGKINVPDKKTLSILTKKGDDRYLKSEITRTLAVLQPSEAKEPVKIEAAEKVMPAVVTAQPGSTENPKSAHIESARKDEIPSVIENTPKNNGARNIIAAEKAPDKGNTEKHIDNAPEASASDASKGKSVERPLLEKLRDGDPRTREAAVRSLMATRGLNDSLKNRIQDLQSDPDPDVRAAALMCSVLLEKKYSSTKELLNDDSKRLKLIALNEIGRTRQQDAVEAVTRLLDDPDGDVSSEAARVLGELGNKSSVEPLIKAAGTGNESLRESAIVSLGALGSREAVPALIKIYKDQESSPGLRKAAGTALCRIKDKRAVPVFVASLESEDWGEFYGAVNALSEIGGADAIKALVMKLMNKQNQEIIIEALAASSDERALSILASLFDSPDKKISSAAIRAAVRTDRSNNLSELFKWMEKDPVRRNLILSLLTGPDEEVYFRILKARSSDKDPQIKDGAAVILSSRLKGASSLQTTLSR